ncbi:MAG: sensor histidine kinase [Lysobacteraceae bacterium]|nr:MAG: sensor histidine kinase [Xanthomonadaceae bacterium]
MNLPVKTTRNVIDTDIGAPLDSLWQGRVVIWVVLAAEGLAAILTLASDEPGWQWVRFGSISLLVQWVALLSLGTLYVLRNYLRAVRPQLIAYLALALLVCNSWLVLLTSWSVLHDVWLIEPTMRGELLLRITLIALIVGWLGLAAFQNHWRARQLAVRAKQAEFAALQARVRPHFLFNTLNTGAALVHHRPDEAEHLLLDLADLFRAALGGAREIPLQEEIALIRRYLEIESLRFRERLRVRWSLPDPVPDVRLPTLSLQPLVENAIRHGIERIPNGGEIEIDVREQADMITVTIANPVPDPSATQPVSGHNVGLPASLAQIQAYTQGRGGVEARSENGRFVVTVRLPMD